MPRRGDSTTRRGDQHLPRGDQRTVGAVALTNGYSPTIAGSVGRLSPGAGRCASHPHAQQRLRTGQSWQCQPTRGGKTPASMAVRISARTVSCSLWTKASPTSDLIPPRPT
jgi:hypothetical protein